MKWFVPTIRRILPWLSISIGLVTTAAPAADQQQQQQQRQDEVTLDGAGATFPEPVYRRWANAYRLKTGIAIRYAAVGSIAGIRSVEQGGVDFGASDVPLTALELQQQHLLQFPALIGAVVPVVHISGIKQGELRLNGQLLGDIYLGTIRKWNDPAIARLNPDLDLPNQNITVVHRGDASGTTWLWSDYLSRSNADWRQRVGAGSVIDWPVGVGDNGNDGVASSVQRTKSSIGYLEYAYARIHSLNCVMLESDLAGLYVAANLASFAAASSPPVEPGTAKTVGRKSESLGAWPITAPSFILLSTIPERARAGDEVMDFFAWAWENGKAIAVELGYVPLSDATAQQNERRWFHPAAR